MGNANTKFVLLILMLLLCTSFVSAKLFDFNSVEPPFFGCSILGCVMQGDIDMNGNTLFNVTIVNASILEVDPVFNIWLSNVYPLDLGTKYNASNPAGFINGTYANQTYYPLYSNPLNYINSSMTGPWVLKSGDTMTGNLNMSDHNITDVDVLFVHNITGRSPIYISSPVIAENNISAKDFYGDTFYGNIQGQNGSIYGVTITNGTISNLRVSDSAVFNTSLIPEYNSTYSLGNSSHEWLDFYAVNLYVVNISSPDIDVLYDLINNTSISSFTNTNDLFNVTLIITLNDGSNYSTTFPYSAYNDSLIWSALSDVNDSVKQPSGSYLVNNTTNFWVNETLLNITINNISKVVSVTQNFTCTTNGGSCNNISTSLINHLITSIKVIPTTPANTYKFGLTEYPVTSNVIDANRATHVGTWNIEKNYAINSFVQANITNSNIDELFLIQITYLTNGVQP